MAQWKVLVVEDDDSIRSCLIEYFREHAGLEVHGARDGVDALHHVATNEYSVVLLDLMMPYMTGVDFLDSLQAMLSDPSVKSLEHPPAVVVVTSAPADHVSATELQQRFPTIVRGVMRKPVDLQQLAERVEELLA